MKTMMAVILSLAFSVTASRGIAQLTLSGQTAVHFLRSAPTESPRDVSYGRPTFGWRSDLFLDGAVTDNVAALANIRVTDDGNINLGNLFDYLAIRMTNLTPLALNIQAGKFDLPFGNLGERRFPRRNPLYGLPLIYEYNTSLPDYIAYGVMTDAGLLASRGKGTGMRLLDQGMYDVGGMLYGSFDVLDYAVALTNGTISSTSYDGSGNTNNGFGTTARIAVTPMAGLTLGGAYAGGEYLAGSSLPTRRPIDVDGYKQQALEVDLEFSRGHAVVSAEGVSSTWKVPMADRDINLGVLGYYVEGKYTVLPRLYVALRANGLHFEKVELGNAVQPWDYDVTEWEGGLGYFLDKDVLLKFVRRETRIRGGTFPKDFLTVFQLVVAY